MSLKKNYMIRLVNLDKNSLLSKNKSKDNSYKPTILATATTITANCHNYRKNTFCFRVKSNS